MKHQSVVAAGSVLLLVVGMLSGCSTAGSQRIDPQRYSILQQDRPRADIVWRKFDRPGEPEVFAGSVNDSKTRGFGFCLAPVPSFNPGTNAVVSEGTLGIFPVQWYEWWETLPGNPPVLHRDAVFNYAPRSVFVQGRQTTYMDRMHVWIYAETKQQVDDLAQYLSGLALFRYRPNP